MNLHSKISPFHPRLLILRLALPDDSTLQSPRPPSPSDTSLASSSPARVANSPSPRLALFAPNLTLPRPPSRARISILDLSLISFPDPGKARQPGSQRHGHQGISRLGSSQLSHLEVRRPPLSTAEAPSLPRTRASRPAYPGSPCFFPTLVASLAIRRLSLCPALLVFVPAPRAHHRPSPLLHRCWLAFRLTLPHILTHPRFPGVPHPCPAPGLTLASQVPPRRQYVLFPTLRPAKHNCRTAARRHAHPAHLF